MSYPTLDRRGMSIIEVLIALVVVGVAFAILSTALVGTLRNTERAGTRTQTTQYLNYIGRLVSGGGTNDVLPANTGDTINWGYGQLAAAFPDLPGGTGGNAANRYRVSIQNQGPYTFAGVTIIQYTVTVCTEGSSGEACVSGTTLGRTRTDDEGAGFLEGIN